MGQHGTPFTLSRTVSEVAHGCSLRTNAVYSCASLERIRELLSVYKGPKRFLNAFVGARLSHCRFAYTKWQGLSATLLIIVIIKLVSKKGSGISFDIYCGSLLSIYIYIYI